ncbi:hypothetical protein FBEOM_2884 [Fusarium beomiforme]|uniref:Uncharacterized protein n=1 Tax=Fusarium beomiforme TaxID=44412 RepID=A0A9P5AQN6_9HYPO|nr:hypothetical protein FBEOM_2884 [Fusarium beomiforme]
MRAFQYLPVEPIQNRRVGTDAKYRPSHRTLYTRNSRDTHWMYHATPLGIFEPSEELIDRLNVFLARHPLDPMPINLAVQGVLLYSRIKSPTLEPEGFSNGKRPVPAVDLEPFILYLPYWLRFHEKGILVSLTGDAQKVGPIWKQIKGKEVIANPQPTQASDEPVERQELETLDPEQTCRYCDAINELAVRAIDWEPLLDAPSAERPAQAEALATAVSLWRDLGREVADAVRSVQLNSEELYVSRRSRK